VTTSRYVLLGDGAIEFLCGWQASEREHVTELGSIIDHFRERKTRRRSVSRRLSTDSVG